MNNSMKNLMKLQRQLQMVILRYLGTNRPDDPNHSKRYIVFKLGQFRKREFAYQLTEQLQQEGYPAFTIFEGRLVQSTGRGISIFR